MQWGKQRMLAEMISNACIFLGPHTFSSILQSTQLATHKYWHVDNGNKQHSWHNRNGIVNKQGYHTIQSQFTFNLSSVVHICWLVSFKWSINTLAQSIRRVRWFDSWFACNRRVGFEAAFVFVFKYLVFLAIASNCALAMCSVVLRLSAFGTAWNRFDTNGNHTWVLLQTRQRTYRTHTQLSPFCSTANSYVVTYKRPFIWIQIQICVHIDKCGYVCTIWNVNMYIYITSKSVLYWFKYSGREPYPGDICRITDACFH